MTHTKRISRSFTAADKSQEIEITCNVSADGIDSVEKVVVWQNNGKTLIELDLPTLEEAGIVDAMIEAPDFDWQREFFDAVAADAEHEAESRLDR